MCFKRAAKGRNCSAEGESIAFKAVFSHIAFSERTVFFVAFLANTTCVVKVLSHGIDTNNPKVVVAAHCNCQGVIVNLRLVAAI